MFDVFYLDAIKPNLFAHEQHARSIEHARQRSQTRYFWVVSYLCDYSKWDFLWEPVPWQAHQCHAWPSQWQKDSGTYLIPRIGYQEVNYHTDISVLRKVDTASWYIPNDIDQDSFDLSWHPDPTDPPLIYQFGTQWHSTGGPQYRVKNATNVKYVDILRAIRTVRDGCWHCPTDIDPDSFDWTWHPDDRDPPYIYQFGTQHQVTGGPQYRMPGAEYVKYVSYPRAHVNLRSVLWHQPSDIDPDSFDWTWHPDDRDPPYIYQFGTQHQVTGGPRYTVPGATEIKYISQPRARRITVDDRWYCPPDIDPDSFDWTWHPDDRDPPYIYQFGTQHQVTGGPRYTVPGATEIKYISQPRARRVMMDDRWSIPDNVNRAAFDWTWHPDDRDPPYIYQFGTQWNRAGGPVYTVPGADRVKYVVEPRARMLPSNSHWSVPDGVDVNSFDFSWTPDATEAPWIYQFGTQHQRTGGPQYRVPGATDIKYVSQPRATKVTVDPHWHRPDHAEFQEDFDWTWHPDTTDPAWIYQFGTQHQRTGGPQYRVPGATDIKYVEQLRLTVTSTHTPAVIIDHLCGNMETTREQIAPQVSVIKTTRYVDSYLGTLQRIAQNTDQEWLWICSSICDYTDFDFTWYPEQWQAGMLHVFSSGDQKFGDTFYMHVPTFRDRAQRCQLLEWYDVNFVPSCVQRRAMPVIQHDCDSQVTALAQAQWSGPLALLTVSSAAGCELPVVPLWRAEVKTVTPLTPGASTVIVPREAQGQTRQQLYDYPYIDRSHQQTAQDQPLDIVFIANGESTRDAAWHMLEQSTLWRPNQVHRVDGVTGRVAAYHAAAQASTTPWFFAVFAKLFVADHFDWSWQPDRMQQPKHYIFHARNPVNGLEYGHQALIAYNRDLVLANTGHGLDFTLDDAHEVVPLLSGVAFYADTPWMAWRTAFREALKLRASLPDVENEYRLDQWLAPSEVRNGDWSQWGAEDAVEYYDSVAGGPEQLRLSYEWAWLASYAFMKRKLLPDA